MDERRRWSGMPQVDVLLTMPVASNLWLYGDRVRVRRLDTWSWKVIPHTPDGHGNPLAYLPVSTPEQACNQVQMALGRVLAHG